jgi:hypothetical protein
MITIEISEKVENTNDMVDLLRSIANLVEEGYTSGFSPDWNLSGEDSEEMDMKDGYVSRE